MARPLSSVATLLVALLSSVLHAQWSGAATNLALADAAGEQTQCKVVATDDGGCYVSWFDNQSGGYDVRLQRLDADGVEQWAHGGVLIADRSFSSTQDYDLDVDAAGNALLAFRDDRITGTQITATKVDASGAQVWGATGVQLTATTAFVAAPKVAGTTDGAVVVAWTQDATTKVQGLDASGATAWGPVTFTPGAGSYTASDMHDADAGSVIVSFVHQTGGFGSPRHILAQKLDAAGALLWGAGHVAVFDGGSIQLGNFPPFVPDGAGGAVFSWYSVSPLQCRAQRVLANGSEAFAHDGVALSTDATRVRVSPSAGFAPATGEVIAFWTEQNALQSMDGVYGQKLDASGARQWGSEGLALVPLGAVQRSFVRTLVRGTGAYVSWIASPAFGQDQVFAARVAGDGSSLVAPFSIATTLSSKGRLDAAFGAQGFAIQAWVDGRSDAGDVYVQNVQVDGSLGSLVCSPADAAARNAGANPAVFAVQNPPILGDTLLATVDVAAAGQAASLLFAFDTAFELTLAGGQVLLCLDLGGSGELLTGSGLLPVASGAVDSYQGAVPLDLSLCGYALCTQAILFGSPPYELSNAQDLTVGG